MNEKYIIGQTNVGSHMWNMQRPDSDLDVFEIYVEPTKNILLGVKPDSICRKIISNPPIDKVSHEIGKVVDMIIKGNINFIWGVFSPITYNSSNEFKELRHLASLNTSKQVFYSINGMSKHNITHLKEEGLTEKKARTILRTIEFGIKLLDGKGMKFEPYDKKLPEDYKSTLHLINSKLDCLSDAYENSSLPDRATYAPMLNDWLIDLRIKQYKFDIGEIKTGPNSYISTAIKLE